MPFLDRLRRWWQSTESVDEDVPRDDGPTPEERRELKAMRAQLNALVSATFAHLGEDACARIARRVSRAAVDEGLAQEPAIALRDGLVGDEYSARRAPYATLFDARYVEDTQLKLRKLSTSYGLPADFLYDDAVEGAHPQTAFDRFQAWLAPHEFALTMLDTGGDEYCLLLVPASQLAGTVERWTAAGVTLRPWTAAG